MPFVDYIQYKIAVINGPEIALEEKQEIIISELSDMPFESFEIENALILAYVQAGQDDPDLQSSVELIDGVESVQKNYIQGENWNKIWEESFDPITIGQEVIIRAPFHIVDKSFTHEIIIEPKMSFGTGHHSTTRLMIESLLQLHVENKTVLDMGCGTGILAILAGRLQARQVTAVDNDPQCIENANENIVLNGYPHLKVFLNDQIPANFKADIILANIQKNVLIEQMPFYRSWITTGGQLLVSGIYEEAVPDVCDAAEKNGFTIKTIRELNEWRMIHFENKN
jgi:ribosomal protein L11 methyltransferase